MQVFRELLKLETVIRRKLTHDETISSDEMQQDLEPMNYRLPPRRSQMKKLWKRVLLDLLVEIAALRARNTDTAMAYSRELQPEEEEVKRELPPPPRQTRLNVPPQEDFQNFMSQYIQVAMPMIENFVYRDSSSSSVETTQTVPVQSSESNSNVPVDPALVEILRTMIPQLMPMLVPQSSNSESPSGSIESPSGSIESPAGSFQSVPNPSNDDIMLRDVTAEINELVGAHMANFQDGLIEDVIEEPTLD